MSTRNNMNTQVIMLVETRNMKNTTKKRTEAFKGWVSLRIKALESILNADMQVMNYWLDNGEPVHNIVFENLFKCIYVSVNKVADEIKKVGIDAKLPVSTVKDSLDELSKMKLKVRRTKSEYKKRFVDLQRMICESKEDVDYVKTTSDLITDTIHQWCERYEIRSYWTDMFTGDKLGATVKMLTDEVLSKKLHPSQEEVRVYVKGYMMWHSVKDA